MKRNGKIARLPNGIREKLNLRLQDNEPGDKILKWLNGQEAVKAVLAEQFGGADITKQNLSEWRTGGFAEWVLGQEVVYEAQDTDEWARRLDAVTDSSLPDRLATVLAGRYASLLARWDGEVTEAFTKKLRALGPLCREICALRRSHHNAIKVKIAQERHEMEKEEGRMKNEEVGKTVPCEPVRPKPMRDYFDPNETWDGGWTGTGTGKEEGRVKNEEWGGTAPSGSVAPGPTTFPTNFGTTTASGVAAAGRHVGSQIPQTPVEISPAPNLHSSSGLPHSATQSDSVAPSPTTFSPNFESIVADGVVAARRHIGCQSQDNVGEFTPPHSGNEGAPVHHSPPGKGESSPVVPGRTTFPPNPTATTRDGVGASCPHPEPAGKPVPNATGSYLHMLLAASRANVLPVQPPIAPLPDLAEEAVGGGR